MSELAIESQNLSKVFRVYRHPAQRIAEWISLGRVQCHDSVPALSSVSLAVEKGEALALLGPNGAGKTTLLRLLAGFISPTQGEIRVDGTVAAMTELNTFHRLLSGRRNIAEMRLQIGSILGQRLPSIEEIAEFADLGEFLDRPVRTYSRGMRARLAFSVLSSVRPRILLCDEVLGAGDAQFRERCARRLKAMREQGTTVVVATHNLSIVRELCDRAMVLWGGETRDTGPVDQVLKSYRNMLRGSR